MELEIREFRKKDYKKAMQFAVTGMHFDWYTDSKLLLNMYAKYFWYLEMTRATQIIAAYTGDEFAGVLLAEVNGEDKKHHNLWESLYVKTIELLQKLFVKGGVGVYDEANKEMFSRFCETNSPDGEIIFLAADPETKIKGIGSFLLREFERREKGKNIYLYTDNACTYQFYEHRGFERVGEKDIVMEIGNKKVDLLCLLYSKVIDC